MGLVSLVVVALLSLSTLFSLASAQCSGAGFDVSGLTGRTLTYNFGGYPWTVNPCGQVSGVPGITCGAQVCQGNVKVSTFSPAAVQWVAADNGLVQISQNGDLCGGDGPRQSTLRFVCNAAATTAYISDAQELPTCHYLLVVQTSLVCTPKASTAIGSTFVSDLCGGGVYPLAQALSEDVVFSPDNNATQVFINVCDRTSSIACTHVQQPASVCQAYAPYLANSTNVFQLADFDPTRSPVQYTRTPNGLIQYYQDGAYANGYPRAMNLTFVCSAAATTAYADPTTWNVVLGPTGAVTYNVAIYTSAVCGTPFTPPTCGGAGVNLNSIAGVQMSYQSQYYVSPCANVLASNTGGCSAQACQGGTPLSEYDPAVAVWTLTDTGVMQQIQNGQGCGGNGPRQSTLRFICNATATTPFILTEYEGPTCHYTLDIATSAACGVTVPRSVGTTWASDLCGGGAYNLNLVSPGNDITYFDSQGPGYVFINPCGIVYNASCAGANAAVCYAYTPLNFTNPNNDYNLATWYPATAPVRYTLLANGITQTHVDGWYCGALPRQTSISYICDQTAPTPVVTNFSVSNCVYTIQVNTNKVCGAAYTSAFTGCGGAGYDLSSSVAGVELTYVQNDDNQYARYTINTCSSVSGYYGLTYGCNAQVCQTGYNLSYYLPQQTNWVPADNGVLQITQTGQQCGSGANRYVVLRFVCNVLATVPSIIEAGEEPACHYFVIVQTNAVCVQPAGLYATGSTFVSDLCGGGAYNLAALSGSDIAFPQSNAVAFFNPCGSVKNASCGNIGGPLDISLCEAYLPLNYSNPNNYYRIAFYDPVRAPVSYTVIPNGLVQYSAAGDFSGNYPRALNVTYVCNAAATTPIITSYTSQDIPQPASPAAGSFQTVYQLVVQTSVVCGAPFQKPQCGAFGINLSGLVGTTLGPVNGYYVAPCSSVHASATYGCTGQVCQYGYPQSYYSPAATTWTQSDTGLVQFSQDGVYCGTSFARATTINYICTPSATTPYLGNAVEDPECHFTLPVYTALACNPATQAAYAVPRVTGTSWVSQLCGGGAYLLTGVSPNVDITYTAPDGSVLYINPCGAVRQPNCSAINPYSTQPSVCQFSAAGAVDLAGWNPPQALITYTLLSNGIQQTHTDGGFCGSLLATTNIQYVCSATATTASVQSFTPNTAACSYTVVIATAAVCGTPYVPTCKPVGYDLTSLASVSIFNYLDNYYYSVSPCGNVTSNIFYPTCTAEVCQDSTVVSFYDPGSVVWTQADNGVVQQQQTGDLCPNGWGFRAGTIRFICNATAITPFIISVGEEPTCHYVVNVHTAAVCPILSPWRANGGTQNLPWVSDKCGGGAYDLTTLGFSDIIYSEGSGNYVIFNPCGYVLNSNCTGLGLSSVCEYFDNQAYQIGIYDPSRSVVTYTLIPGGLVQSYMDGAFNFPNNEPEGFPRAMNITYTCSAAATTPVITSYTVAQRAYNGALLTQYQMAVTTSAVCGAPFTYTSTCGTPTYNLNSLVGSVISYTDSSQTPWWLSPCGQVDVPDAYGCTGQVCQSGYIVSYYSPAATTWIPADNGVVAFTQDGLLCGGLGPRTAYIRYVCSAAATTPVITSIAEEPTCHYTLVVQTSTVCGITPSHAVGSTFISDFCGGGAYDLTQLAPTTDIVGVVDGSNFLFINPCGVVRNASCNNLGAAVCYGFAPLTNPPTNDYDIARFTPQSAPIRYTVLSNGVMQTHIDGDYCGDQSNIARVVQISYVCDATMTTPTITSYSSAACAYNITVSTALVCGTPFNVAARTGSLCYMTYSLPGNVDYPWSVATQMSFTYNPTLSYTASGTAVQLLTGSGTRTFTNRFGAVSQQTVTLSTSANLLYVGASNGPLDANGLTFTTSSPVQLPGYSAAVLSSLITLNNATGGTSGQPGTIVEAGSSRVDKAGQVFLSNVPGFQNVTIGASDINALAAVYSSCQAPITFTNGLRAPTAPSAFNGATNFTFAYTITDGVTYSVQTNLRLIASSAFATTKDQLGNPYQTITGISGTRTYTYLYNGQSLTSTVTGLTSATQKPVDQRFFPYSLIGSSPGVYTLNSVPLLDYDGLGFTISPAAPNLGFPIGSASSGSVVSVFVNGFTSATTTAALTEYITAYGTAPLSALQQQTFSLV